MLAAGDYLYTVTDSGIAMCWEGKTGDVKWKKRLGGNFSSSPILVGDLLYVADLKGNTYVFKASSKAYEEVAVNVLGNDSYASPGVAENSLLMRCGFREGGELWQARIFIGQAAYAQVGVIVGCAIETQFGSIFHEVAQCDTP